MSHMTDRALSDKDKILDVFNKHSETSQKYCCSVSSISAECKCFKHNNYTHGHYKMKRLKSRKERSQMRGGGREAKQHHHHYQHHSSCYCTLRRDTSFPNVIPATQEPSIITDNRLIGHHGLFNHEVKSIDIERLLSEQKKQERIEKQVPEKNHVFSHPSLTCHNPSPVSSNDLSGADTNVPFVKKADPATNAHNCWEKEKKISEGSDKSDGSDVTPGQRPQQELNLSSEGCKSIFSSKHSSLDVVVSKRKSKKTHSVMSKGNRKSESCSTGDRDNLKTIKRKLNTQVTSTAEHTPKNQKPPIQQTQAQCLSPSQLNFSSSSITENSEIQNRRQDPSRVCESVCEVAARLCDCLHFPFLRRRNLVTESRDVLLRALQERHGPRLQENLLKLQRHLSLDGDLTTMKDEDVHFPADVPAYRADTAIHLGFDTHRTTSLKMSGIRNFNWPSLHPHRSWESTAEWLTDPTDTSASLLDGVLRPSCSPQFCMETDPPEASASDHLFSPSATSCWAGKTSASQHWEDSWIRPKSKESFMFDFFENSFLNHSRLVRESCGSQHSGSNSHPFFSYPAQQPDGHSSEPVRFPQEPDQFVTDRHAYAPIFSAQIHHPNQNNYFQTSSRFSQPSTCLPLRSHNTDMMLYPPSHMLDREPAPPFSSLPSPEHWSFPPMRLY